MLITTRNTTTRYETKKGTAICGLPHSFDGMFTWGSLLRECFVVQSLSFVSPARTLFHPADVAIWNSSRNAFGTLQSKKEKIKNKTSIFEGLRYLENQMSKLAFIRFKVEQIVNPSSVFDPAAKINLLRFFLLMRSL